MDKKQIYDLDNRNVASQNVKLGTLLNAIESETEKPLNELTKKQVYDLTNDTVVTQGVQLGNIVDALAKGDTTEIEDLTEKQIKQLDHFLNSELQIIEYQKAIEILQQADVQFEDNNIHFGLDLATEHEKYLTDVYFKAPVAIINYTKEFKAFYMYLNDDGKTVAAFDLLVPGVGELIGGSQREADCHKLIERMKYYNISEQDMK